MITTRAVVACDGWTGVERCRKSWTLRDGMGAAHTIAAAQQHGWAIGSGGDWCPVHARERYGAEKVAAR